MHNLPTNKLFFLLSLFLPVLLFLSCKKGESNSSSDVWVMEAPAGSLYTEIQIDGKTVLPNGRILTPLGKNIRLAPHPYGLTLSPDGSTLVTANSGTVPISITIIRNFQQAQAEVRQVPEGYKTEKGILESVFMGLAIDPNNEYVYVSAGQSNKIYLFRLSDGAKTDSIDCKVNLPGAARDYSHGYLGDMVMSKDGKRLFVVDQVNFCMNIIDTEQKRLIHRVAVGRYPFGITLSPDEKEAYVVNVGMFEYKPIASLDPNDLPGTALRFPPYAYGSKEMKEGINTDTLKVPGLGDPNVPESFSVWTIDLRNTAQPTVSAKVKTGILVGELVEGIPAVGGSSPNSVVATDKYVFVSNGGNDCISVVDIQSDKVIDNIYLSPDPRLKNYRGILPFGLALSPDKKRLYVAESGINAVAVIDAEKRRVLGHLPVGWFPSKLAVSKDGKQLMVANAKGYGSGPNGGVTFTGDERGSYVGALMAGTVSILDIPSDQELQKHTEQVVNNNFAFFRPGDTRYSDRKNNPVPILPGQSESPIKYLVFITKENRTYDQVFGQLPGGNGDSTIASLGYRATVRNRAGTLTVSNTTIMPNHLALAKQFAISDNFYCDADHSADGHKWLADTYPNQWAETEVISTYGGGRSEVRGSQAPGNLGVNASNGSISPEDYNEAGSIWEHLERNKVPFFNFGSGIMFAPDYSVITDRKTDKHAGYKYLYNYPLSAALFRNTSKLFPTYNTGIPEQYRADMFMREYRERWESAEGKAAKEEFPRMLFIYYGMDHGDRERPEDGYPFNTSYMVDNDLALGRTIEFLSQTPYWKNMAIIITEDDAQGGIDHVDAHRSLLMVISPYAKRSHIGHVHYSFGSIFKTFWNILGIPYLNQFDASPSDISELFTDTPDYRPYRAVPIDTRIFDPVKALTPLDEKFNWEAVRESAVLDNVADFVRDHANK